jgi:hypothetical protein
MEGDGCGLTCGIIPVFFLEELRETIENPIRISRTV